MMEAKATFANASSSPLDSGDNAYVLVQAWLFIVALLIFAMIVVGGATRLTDSGLSITEWQPILGVIPPLTAADWELALEKYRQIPEYQLVNKGMSLDEFKFIYWWEWAHRFLGRFIGLAFAVPLAVFWAMGRIPKGYGWKLIGIFALGGLQGFFGWYMVQSGLSERVDVSHYRLALHLTTAFVILAAVLWVAFDLSKNRVQDIRLDTISPTQRNLASIIVALLLLQVVIGAFVAGLKAGLTHNTWPLMDGGLVPLTIAELVPWYLNLVENPATVQFVHRLLAYLLVGLATWHAISLWRTADDERLVTSSTVLLLAFFSQAALGVWTLLAAADQAEIPIGLGLVHQGGGAVLLAAAIWHLHRISRPA